MNGKLLSYIGQYVGTSFEDYEDLKGYFDYEYGDSSFDYLLEVMSSYDKDTAWDDFNDEDEDEGY